MVVMIFLKIFIHTEIYRQEIIYIISHNSTQNYVIEQKLQTRGVWDEVGPEMYFV